VTEHIHFSSHGDVEDQLVREVAMRSWTSMKRSLVAGPRKTLPTPEEIQFLLSGKTPTCIVFFLDETFEEISYDLTTTVSEAMKQLADIIRLQNYSTFTLFECRKIVDARATEDAVDEHLALDDNRYIADVIFDMKNPKNARDGIQSKFLVKKRMFRETDEAITEPQFINLSYIQAQYDYLLGNFPFVPEDTAQLCALQIQAEYGTSILNNEEELSNAVTKYIPKQSATSRSHEEWLQDVKGRYRSMDQFSKEEARVHFLRILRSLPYGNSIFFPVKKLEDPIGLLPVKLILGINRRGVHFFKPSPKEYLHSAELRDIMQFGSSSQAVFFKMRVSGVLHIFQFETRQGEDICLALQTHINDIMMKRYSKSKAAASHSAAGGQTEPAAVPESRSSKATAHTGPRHEKHANQMQKTLDEKLRMIEELQKREEELHQEKDRVAEELIEAKEKLKVEEEQIDEFNETKKKLEADRAALLQQIKEAREAVGEAEANRAAAVDAARQAVDAKMVKELEAQIHDATEELQKVQDRVQGLEKEYKDATKDKELMEKKMKRLEKSRDNETRELRNRLGTAKASVDKQLKEKEDAITELMDELAKTTELYNANKLELEQIKTDLNELEDLREMKCDVEREEKLQKKIIADQAKRLEELEKLHKEEQMLRKKYLSMMEDMQGKVRVFVRLAPNDEEGIVDVVDEYTLAKKHDDRFAVREEFAFDQAYGPTQTNKEVFETVKPVASRCIEGYNVCIVGYGLAGSGKSHTMFGAKGDGIVAMSVDEIFAIAKKRSKKWDFEIKASMIELYDEELTDLFASTNKKLVVKKDVKGLVHVINTSFTNLTSTELLRESIRNGLKKRDESGHDASNSHLFVTIAVTCSNKETGVINDGRIVFSDLVGCDRGNASINAIQTVVRALEADLPEIPYTACTLSKLLSDCFGGNAKTLILVHAKSDENLWEDTKQALELGLAIRKIKNDIEKSEINKDILKLKRQLDTLKERAGVPKELLDAVDMVEIVDHKAPPSDTAQAAS